MSGVSQIRVAVKDHVMQLAITCSFFVIIHVCLFHAYKHTWIVTP